MSRHYCKATNCDSIQEKCSAKSFFRFPDDIERKTAWCNALDLDLEQVERRAVICSDHFEDEDVTKSTRYQRLGSTAVPRLVQTNVPQPVSVPLPLVTGQDRSHTPARKRHAVRRRLDMSTDGLENSEAYDGQLFTESSENSDPITSTPISGGHKFNSGLAIRTPFQDTSNLDNNTTKTSIQHCASEILTPKTKKIRVLGRKVKTLKQKHNRLKSKIGKTLIKLEDLDTVLCQTFGNASCSYLIREQWSRFTDRKRKHYNEKEKISALTLMYSFRPQGYRKLQKILGLQLPSLSGIRRWLSKLT